MDDLLSEFLTETAESLAVIDVELVKFEQQPNDTEILGNIFRLVHTIKGTCGFLGLPRLEAVAHAGENVLGKFRDGELEVTPEAVTLILRCIDTIRDLLGELEESGEEPEGQDSELIAQLNAMAEGNAPSAAAAPAPAAEAPAEASATVGDDAPSANEFGAPVAAELLAEVEAAEADGITAASDAQMKAEAAAESAAEADAPPANEFGAPVAAELLAEVEEAQAKGIVAASDAQMKQEAAAEVAADAAKTKVSEAAKPPVKVDSKTPTKEDGGAKEGGVAASSIRVNVDVLEDLMTLVSELVLTRNALLQMVRGIEDSEFTVPLQRLSHITSDLQEGVMKTRMQPIGNAWAKLPRIVRDLSVDSGKKIDLVMLGADTELDRQVLELIKDPLTHMVRNSADHGLETPDDRTAIGKPEKGTITLNAFHEGGHIIIEIKDDGKGLNMDRIRNKIIENGLATESDLEGLTDTQIQQYIFRAGFSTAEKVTNVSGRGVGMDVVRTNIEQIGGTIELKSIEGKGTTFTIKIPLTLAIVSALIVECAGERFAIPQLSVLELVRASSQTEHRVEMINDSPVLRLRNRLLPLVMLRDLLKLDGAPAETILERIMNQGGEPKVIEHDDVEGETIEAAPAEETASAEDGPAEELFIVVAQVGAYNFGIVVDKVFDTEEIVVKPVAPVLRDQSVYSGNTILGDGSVIMILDPNGIANANGEVQGEDVDTAEQDQISRGEESTSLLVFKAGGAELKAVPLALIARLEEIDAADIEIGHGRHLVQYRGHLMPLVPFDPSYQFADTGHLPVLVFTDRDRSMGLVVDEIVDIVEDKLKIEISSKVEGVIGTATVDGKAVDIMDSGYFLTQAFPDWFGNPSQGSAGESRSVLLVDDSQFFRQLLSPLLSVAGWHVQTCETAEEALRLRDQGVDFDVIVSDIEMPGMSGYEFAQTVRTEGRWKDIPMVALSGHTDDSDMMKGREAGFSDYVAKYDREVLVDTLAQTVSLAMRH